MFENPEKKRLPLQELSAWSERSSELHTSVQVAISPDDNNANLLRAKLMVCYFPGSPVDKDRRKPLSPVENLGTEKQKLVSKSPVL